jgi:hypothetical protein
VEWYGEEGNSSSVTVTFAALLAKALLLVQHLGLDLLAPLLDDDVVLVVSLEHAVVDLPYRDVVLQVEVLFFRHVRVIGETEKKEGGGEGDCTHDFAEEDDVLAANEKESVPVLGKGVPVVYSLDCVLEDEVRFEAVSGVP